MWLNLYHSANPIQTLPQMLCLFVMNRNKPTAYCSTATNPWAQIILQVLFAHFPGCSIAYIAPLIIFTIPLSDTLTNEILEGQFKPLKSIIHFENGWYPFPQKAIYNMYRYNTTQCDIFQQYKLYQTVLEYIFVTFTILSTLFPME